MKEVVSRAALLAAFALLVACGGGGGSSSLPATANGPSTATPFSVTVGSGSSVTKIGIASSAESGSPEHDFSVAAGSSGCTASGTARVCTASIALPTGAQTLTVTTYGATTVHSTMRTSLSGARVALAVGTAIAQISLDLAAAQLTGGTAGSTTLYVTARDANGNTIVGSFGGATIAVTSSDTTNSITLSPTSITAGGTAVAVSYNGSGSVTSVTFNATSSGVAASAIVPATLTFTASQLIYVANGNSVLSFPAGGSGDLPPLQRVTVTNVPTIYRAAPDGAGNIWLAVPNPNPNAVGGSWAIGSIPASSTGPVTMTYLPQSVYPAGQSPWDFGVDAAGNLYLFSLDGVSTSTVTVYPPNSQTAPIRTITGSSTMLSSALMQANALIGVSADGTIVIPYYPYLLPGASTYTAPGVLVFAPGANGNVAPAQVISGAATVPAGSYGEIFDAHEARDGSIVALVSPSLSGSESTAAGAVEVFAPGATGNVAPVRTITGSATGLNILLSSYSQHAFGVHGIETVAVDAASNIYVAEYGSQSIANAQLEEFAPGANGNVPPAAVLGGPLTSLTQPYAVQVSGGAVAPAATGSSAVVSGDFLSLTPNRGWNYTMTTPTTFGATSPTTTTVSLWANPTPVDGDTQLVAYEVPGVQTTALNVSGSILAAEGVFAQGAGGGWSAEGYVPISNGASLGGIIPIPSGLGLTRGTFALGQTFDAYLGLTGSVVSVGAVPGSPACPGGAANGAIVAYTFGQTTETVGYVPGCGITYFVSDNGTTAILTSVGTYSSVATSSSRAPASLDTIRSLRSLWQTVFTPWRAR
jgi:YD repeat-containing protein